MVKKAEYQKRKSRLVASICDFESDKLMDVTSAPRGKQSVYPPKSFNRGGFDESSV